VEDRQVTVALLADGVTARIAALADELVALKPAVIVARSNPGSYIRHHPPANVGSCSTG